MDKIAETVDKRFRARMCRDRLGLNLNSPEASQRFKDEPEVEKRSAGFVRQASEMLEDIIKLDKG